MIHFAFLIANRLQIFLTCNKKVTKAYMKKRKVKLSSDVFFRTSDNLNGP